MAAEIASGMSYLHTFARSPIIHGDLKLQNILIGGDFNAKASSILRNHFTVQLDNAHSCINDCFAKLCNNINNQSADVGRITTTFATCKSERGSCERCFRYTMYVGLKQP